jgi:hypothetical protein
MTFFYDLNKKLDGIRATPELTHTQLNERNMSRAAKGWAKFGDGMTELSQAAKKGASEEKMDAIRKKHDKYNEAVEEGAYQGGPDKSQIPAVNRPGNKLTTADLEKERTQSPTSAEGMRALQDKLSKINPLDEIGDTPAGLEKVKAYRAAVGRQYHKTGEYDTRLSDTDRKPNPFHAKDAENMPNAANQRYNRQTGAARAKKIELARAQGLPAEFQTKDGYVEEGDMEEGNAFGGAVAKAKADGIQPGEKINVGGKEYPVKEAAKYRDAKYKDKLYTQEPRDYDQYDYGDDDYYNPKPADYPGEKRKIGGGEFDHNDPLQKGQGIGRSGIKNNILDRGPRKGLPSRDQITSLKGSIKSAKGTHSRPNLPEAAGAVDFDKVLDAIAALYGDDMWENDAMQDLANDLAQAGPTDRELDFIIANGRLPKRLANTQFSAGDNVQFGEASSPMTAKQKSFAKLAPPADKITFADKIAGAKQEVDEMLGDVAAEAMKTALRGRQNNTEKVDEVEGKVYRHKGTYGQSYDPSDDEETKANVRKKKDAAGPAKRGRPEQNTKFDFSAFKKPVVAKGTGSGRVHKLSDKEPGQKVKEGSADGQAQQIYNELADLRAAAKQAQRGGQFPQGFASRLESVLYAAMTLIKNQQPGNAQVQEEELDEKASSKKQQKFMGMVHAAQKGEKPASEKVAKTAKSMGKKDAEDFASTKHKGLPEKKKPEGKKKEESVEENTVAGSVAPAAGGAAKGKGGMSFGKGVYEGAIAESFNRKLDSMLNEGMSVNMSADQDGKKSLTVTATDDDAVKLSQLLNLAGIGGQSDSYGAVCASCGSADCSCDHIDEDLANSAHNTVYNADALQYSGGLDGPKTDQSTLGTVINQDPRRTIGSVAEGVENRLWELYQRYERK